MMVRGKWRHCGLCSESIIKDLATFTTSSTGEKLSAEVGTLMIFSVALQ